MSSSQHDCNWIWHPDWNDSASKTSAGGFVDFRNSFYIHEPIVEPVIIHVSADTRYRLYVNNQFLITGPVKGDHQQWHYDEVDIQPLLYKGMNTVAVRVMRFFHGSQHAITFVRMPIAGLYVRLVSPLDSKIPTLNSHATTWEASIDHGASLPTNIKDDDFLHVYEEIDRRHERKWLPAINHIFMSSYGLGTPWRLVPRPIPHHKIQSTSFKAIHNVQSSVPIESWTSCILQPAENSSVRLPSGTVHHIELEADEHVTAFLDFVFSRPLSSGSVLNITYAECYEDEPTLLPYLRRKRNRIDSSKGIYGPRDKYVFGGEGAEMLEYGASEKLEVYTPFHFRTYRIISIDIRVDPRSELVFEGICARKINYDLQVKASFDASSTEKNPAWINDLWNISLRTLQNCMHDSYEDCPFYEQLQYAMDTRSSALFTYYVSGDDRLARLFLKQLHHSFQPRLGLTASRAPSHQLQLIPHFSLFWACAVVDHHAFVGDAAFTTQFLGVIDAVLGAFSQRVDSTLHLVRSYDDGSFWEFVDWVPSWKPFGVPPAASRSGVLTYTNCLYAYTLEYVSGLLEDLKRDALAAEYRGRAQNIKEAVRKHCFDGEYFTDGLAKDAESHIDYSVHSQVWAVLAGACTKDMADKLLSNAILRSTDSGKGPFDGPSVAQSFYTLRALSATGLIYEKHFYDFWQPWMEQVSQNVSTWVEDNVSQRSDCHAWGSAPLYEFLAEVAGIRPHGAGWSAISCQPRLGLLPDVKSRIPISSTHGHAIIEVEWHRKSDGSVSAQLTIESDADHFKAVKTHITMPDDSKIIVKGLGPHAFSVADPTQSLNRH